MAGFTDRHVDVTEVLGPAGAGLTERVRAAMRDAPLDVRSHAGALAAFEEVLRPLLPLDAEGELVNRLVALVEERPDLVRTAQLAAETGLSERALQRLVSRRLGLTPKWLIQRRRLHEAAARLRADTGSTLAETAALLGYADQAHFVRDFSRVTGTTPGRFAGEHRAALSGRRGAVPVAGRTAQRSACSSSSARRARSTTAGTAAGCPSRSGSSSIRRTCDASSTAAASPPTSARTVVHRRRRGPSSSGSP